MLQYRQSKGKGVNEMRTGYDFDYERKLIDELEHSKFSWNTVLKAIQLYALTTSTVA